METDAESKEDTGAETRNVSSVATFPPLTAGPSASSVGTDLEAFESCVSVSSNVSVVKSEAPKESVEISESEETKDDAASSEESRPQSRRRRRSYVETDENSDLFWEGAMEQERSEDEKRKGASFYIRKELKTYPSDLRRLVVGDGDVLRPSSPRSSDLRATREEKKNDDLEDIPAPSTTPTSAPTSLDPPRRLSLRNRSASLFDSAKKAASSKVVTSPVSDSSLPPGIPEPALDTMATTNKLRESLDKSELELQEKLAQNDALRDRLLLASPQRNGTAHLDTDTKKGDKGNSETDPVSAWALRKVQTAMTYAAGILGTSCDVDQIPSKTSTEIARETLNATLAMLSQTDSRERERSAMSRALEAARRIAIAREVRAFAETSKSASTSTDATRKALLARIEIIRTLRERLVSRRRRKGDHENTPASH